MSQIAGCPVVDADGHVIELPDMWQEYIDPAYRERAPRMVRGEDGGLALLLGDELVARIASRLGAGGDERFESGLRRAGGWKAAKRLEDMDADGIDVAVLFPTLAFFACETGDLGLDAAVCRAFNDWVGDYCKTAPDRLVGVALLPLRDIDASIAELERATEKLGFRGAFVRPNPYGDCLIQNRAYDRFWSCAESLGIPIAIHEGISDTLPTLGRDRFENPALQHLLSHPFEQMAACAALIGTGVLERHPRLRFAVLESGCGWLPYWLSRMDSHFETWRSFFPALELRPSAYFRRQCFISCDSEDEVVRSVVDFVGDECVVWASDYPHPDAWFPGSVGKALESLTGLPAESRRRILGENATRLFGLNP